MNYKLIFKLIGNILKIEALFMLFPLAIAYIYGDGDHVAFLWSILTLLVTGLLLSRLKPADKRFKQRDAFAAAGFAWLTLSLFGALPFYLSGCFPSFVDCVFESASGFTTTGASILTNIEVVPRGIVFWRSVSHWIGGMGFLVFMLAILPSANASSLNLLRAESTGPTPDKMVPKIKESARITYLIYLAMTVVLVLLLCITGMPIFDSLNNAFSVAGTGGFAIKNASIGAYDNVPAEVVMSIFMFLFGVSFTLYFFLLGKDVKKFIKDSELRFFFGVVVVAILIITINITDMYGGVAEALRHASFQVTSIISTTGFSTTDFNLWPSLSQVVLILLMVTGCCAGSTGGGIKLIRILLLLKAAKIELGKIFHPGSVKAVSINGKKIGSEIVSRTALFFFVYFVVYIVSVMLISIEGKDIVTNATAVFATLSNVGPGLGEVGPTGNFSEYTQFSKLVLSFCMIAGRLEFYPILVLLTPSVWKGR